MNPERWEKVDELFHSALERDRDARAAFLATACGSDDELLHELESMLAHHQEAKSFMESPAYALEAESIVADDALPALSGGTFGSYQVLSQLGRGGMGEVYLAFDKELKRKVALKFLNADLIGDKRRMRRFKQEARAASALNHPNILTVFEFGEIDHLQFIATEFVKGRTLREVMNSGQMKLRQVYGIAVQIASALSAAHRISIVHRDIKPENIMLRDDGIVKVLDFGLAKVVQTGASAVDPQAETRPFLETAPGEVMGTVAYMSPEQVRGLKVDVRTDIWSLGVVLYELVAGRKPFEGETSSHVSVAILEREPPPLNESSRQVPTELQRIVQKALAKNRDDRYQTARDLTMDLKNLPRVLDNQAEAGQTAITDEIKADHTQPGQQATSDSTNPIIRAANGWRRLLNKGGPTIAFSVLLIATVSLVYLGVRHRLRRNMIYIPGGTFRVGFENSRPFVGSKAEVPSHAVTVSSFWMDVFEVTNQEYFEFVRATKHVPPADWSADKPPPGQEKWPVANVSFEDANAFAAWRSKRDGEAYRLPTEEEWEYAARGGDEDNFYPWGSIWREGFANVQGQGGNRKPVGSYPQGKSRWGNLDMIGNVWEWTSSRASFYPGNAIELPEQHRDWLILRGGCYATPVHGSLPLTATIRNWVAPTYKNAVLGFRLVRTAK